MDASELDLKPEWTTKPEVERLHEYLAAETTFTYSQDLEEEAAKETLVVQNASPEDQLHQEQIFDEEKYSRLQEKVAKRRELQVELINLRQAARQRLMTDYDKLHQKSLLEEERNAYEEHVRHAKSTKRYHKAEHKLKHKLKEKQGDVTIGMRESNEELALYGAEVRTYKVSWKRRPQPIEIRMHQARVVKDKLSKGRFSIRVAVWDRIGGRPIAFSKEDPSFWKKETQILDHGGEYSDLELLFDDNLDLLAPSKMDLRPTMILLFELVSHGIRDEILGTAVFPLCNSELDYIQGKFKAPFLRGIIHRRMERFSDIEAMYSRNVDDWLCNLYFEVRKQVSLQTGQKDYTVVLTREPEAMEQTTSQGLETIEYETLRTPDQFVGFGQSVALDDVFSNPVARAKYLVAEVVAELGLLAWKHLEFWLSLLFLALSIWLSRYTHYVGEFLFLKGQRVPVTSFDVKPYTIDITYPAQMTLQVEIGVILLGLVFTLSCFIFLALVAFTATKVLGKFPTIGYRFISCFGIVTVFDCLITIIETVIRNKSDGDMYKLYNYFGREEGSPAIGAFLTGFVYLGMIGVAAFFFYNYLLYVHMHGRLLDMYMRLTAPEDHFFLPSDCEVSARYLDWVCFKARSYRAINGDVRKICVSEYSVFGEMYRHISIYTVGNDHSRVLYRHFLILHTGAICELSFARLGYQ